MTNNKRTQIFKILLGVDHYTPEGILWKYLKIVTSKPLLLSLGKKLKSKMKT